MSSIKNWSTVAGDNNDPSPNGFPENMAPSGLNDSAREMMAAIRTQWEGAEWFDWNDAVTYVSATQFSLAGDLTGRYTVDRRIKVSGSITGEVYGTITTSTFTTLTTVTVALDSGSLNNESLACSLAIINPAKQSIKPINKVTLGIENVTNTSDDDKPVSTAQQAALDLKANLASPALTGTPTAPTATAGTNTTQLATTAFVQAASSGIGVGQTWQNLIGSRSNNVTYTNSTGDPIMVTVSGSFAASNSCYFYINGNSVAFASNQFGDRTGNIFQASFIIPDGDTYKFYATSSISYWWELR